MNTTIYATFDGEVLRPECPVQLPANRRLRVAVEILEDEPKVISFLDTAESLNLEGPADWSSRLEDYLYGKTRYGD